MYKIKVINLETGKTWWEYGFNSFMVKRINFLLNDKNNNHYNIYEILEMRKIVLTRETFKKCLMNKVEYL